MQSLPVCCMQCLSLTNLSTTKHYTLLHSMNPFWCISWSVIDFSTPGVINCGLPLNFVEEDLLKTYTMVGVAVWVCPRNIIAVCQCVHMVYRCGLVLCLWITHAHCILTGINGKDVCMYVPMYVRMQTPTHKHLRLHTNTHTHAQTVIHTHMHKQLYTHTCTLVCTHTLARTQHNDFKCNFSSTCIKWCAHPCLSTQCVLAYTYTIKSY